MKNRNKILFWIFIVMGIITLGLNFLKTFLEIDIFAHISILNNLRDEVRALPKFIKMVVVSMYALVLIILSRGFTSHIDNA